MSEPIETSSGKDGRRLITVRRLAPTYGVTSRQIARAVRITLHDRPIETVSVAVVDDDTIASLHERYLGDPRATDVLAFDLRDNADDERIDGEIIVSSETARRQAARLRLDADTEIIRYAIHGTLHLMGYDDRTPAGRRRMRRAENRILAALDKQTRDSRRPHQPRREMGRA